MNGTTTRRQFRAPRQPPVCARTGKLEVPSRVARLLALAHHIENLIESGKLKDYADAARELGLTRARMTQVANLLQLSPTIQERILVGELRVSERSLRGVGREADWLAQSAVLESAGPAYGE